jgi:3-phosphoshikimate 1-carboxyvinyltransferase
MSETLEIGYSGLPIQAIVELPGSKSLSNRLLLLEYFSGNLIQGKAHSDAADTINLAEILKNLPPIADAGEGGTTSRFALTALAATPGYVGVLKGSNRLTQRPISELVNALRKLGADLTYLENENQLPIQIIGKQLKTVPIELNGTISSQFLSALLLLGTYLSQGIEVKVIGKIVSKPYLDMSIKMLRFLNFQLEENNQVFRVYPQNWTPTEVIVEKDWSSASYWYSIVALAPKASVMLEGLKLNSFQGDSLIADIFSLLGVSTTQKEEGLLLEKTNKYVNLFTFDCIDQPDIAQTLAVTITGLRIKGHLTGLSTLRGKETDRIEALKHELQKMNVRISEPVDGELLIDARFADFGKLVIIDTYNDHRMALSFAPLVLKVNKIAIRNPKVIEKSYPNFWRELEKASISLTEWEF